MYNETLSPWLQCHRMDGRRSHEGEIRVLVVLIGVLCSPLVCGLHHVRLDGRTSYEALSYCWGDPKRSHYIDVRSKCSGVTKPTRLVITPSAFEALQYLRSAETMLHIWFDQICTNQDDLAEKSIQVQQMGTSRALLTPSAHSAPDGRMSNESVTTSQRSKRFWHGPGSLSA